MYKTLNGQRKHLNEWAKEYGIPHSTLCERMRSGWSLVEALITPPLKSRDHIIKAVAQMHRETFIGVEYADQIV